jgi:hypothetical protein
MNRKSTRPRAIFLIIGILLLVISYLTKGTSVGNIDFLSKSLNSLGFILLTVVVVNWLWETLGGEPIASTLVEFRSSVQLLDDSHSSGLHRFIPVSGELGSHGDWMERLKSSQHEINLLGYTLHVWTRGHNFIDEVKNLVRNGVRIRFMIMDDNNPHLSCLVNEIQITHISLEQVKDEIRVVKRTIQKIHDDLESEPEGSVKGSLQLLTVKQGIVVCQICRTDNELTVVNYQWSAIASHSPLLLVRGRDTKLFESYVQEFESLWELNSEAPGTERAGKADSGAA